MKRRMGVRWQRVLVTVAWGCGVLLTSVALAAPVASDGTQPAVLLRLGGRLHPLIVHFPIALLLTALLVESFQLLRRRHKASPTALVCLSLGVIAAAAAIASGLANEKFESHGQALIAAIDRHQLLGIAAGVAGAVALFFGLLTRASTRSELRAIYCFGLLVTGVLTGVTGHLGGSLVYGDDYLTSVIWSDPRTPAPITQPPRVTLEDQGAPEDSSVYFDPHISSIIETHCANCHGPSRQRGGLRLDDYATLFADEPFLWVAPPFEPESSEMLRRVRLPEGDDDAMPPKGERLSVAEIALIEQWIVQGARERRAERAQGQVSDEPSASLSPPIATGAEQPSEPVDQNAQERLPRAEVDWASIKSIDTGKADASMARLIDRGVVAKRIVRGSEAVEVDFSLLDTPISDDDLELLHGLESTLVWLNLAGTSITDEGLASLAAFDQLRRVHLERTSVTDSGLASLATLPRLEYLNLYSTSITDAGLQSLQNARELRELYLWRTRVTGEGVRQFRLARPHVLVVRQTGEAPSTTDGHGTATTDDRTDQP